MDNLEKLYKTLALADNAGNLKEIIEDIDYNFRLLLASEFMHGLKGDSLTIMPVNLKDKDGKLTQDGQDVLKAIYGTTSYVEDDAKVSLPDSVLGYYIVNNEGQQPNPKLVYTSYSPYADYRIKQALKADMSFEDKSCNFYGILDEDQLIWRTSSANTPRIGWDNTNNQWTWWYDGVNTQVPCGGVKGNDGAGSELLLFKSSKKDGDKLIIEKQWQSANNDPWQDVSTVLPVNTFAFAHYVDADDNLLDLYFAPIKSDSTGYYIDIQNAKGIKSIEESITLNDLLSKIGQKDYQDTLVEGLWIPFGDEKHMLKNESTNDLHLFPTDEQDHKFDIDYNVNLKKQSIVSELHICDSFNDITAGNSVATTDLLKELINSVCPIGTIRAESCQNNIHSKFKINGKEVEEGMIKQHPENYKDSIIWMRCWGETTYISGLNSFSAPDLRDRFLMGAGDSFQYTGGRNSFTLDVKNLPDHHHYIGSHKHDIKNDTIKYDSNKDAENTLNDGHRSDYVKANTPTSSVELTATTLQDVDGNNVTEQKEIDNRPRFMSVMYWIRVQ